jgi:hypothetical protein
MPSEDRVKAGIWNSGLFMTLSGLAGMVLSILADVVGLGRPGFGLDQAAGLVLGAFACLAGLVRLYATNKGMIGRILAGLYILGVLLKGLVPHPGWGTRVEIFWDAEKFFSRDFFINTVGFFMVGYLLMLGLEHRGREQGGRQWVRKAALVVLAGGLLSCFVELSQYLWVPGRTPSSADLAANVLGTAVGVLLYGVRPTLKQRVLSGPHGPANRCTLLPPAAGVRGGLFAAAFFRKKVLTSLGIPYTNKGPFVEWNRVIEGRDRKGQDAEQRSDQNENIDP